MINYYNLYLHNIKSLVKNFGFIPHWIDLKNEKFFNHSTYSFSDFNTDDKFLQKFSEDKSKLGEDIITNGTFSPFFFYWDKEYNKKYLCLGKHRLYSLLLHMKNNNIKRKFLFLEYPVDPLHKCKDLVDRNKKIKGDLYFWENTNQVPILKKENTLEEACVTILLSGDSLSNWLYENKVTPSTIINDEQKFNKFINS